MTDLCEPVYSVADLRWTSVREFTMLGTGKYYKTSNGKLKEKTVGVEYVNTAGAGRMRLDDWYAAMEQAIDREGLSGELEAAIKDAAPLAWLKTDEDRRRYALEHFSRREKA